jgi:hypothetical protein
MDQEVLKSHPTIQCTAGSGGEGSALTMSQLSGIWIVSFGFAFVGLCVTVFMPFWRRKFKPRGIRVHKRDQIGVVVETLDMDDDQELLKGSMKRLENQKLRRRVTRQKGDRAVVSSAERFSVATHASSGADFTNQNDGITNGIIRVAKDEEKKDLKKDTTERSTSS